MDRGTSQADVEPEKWNRDRIAPLLRSAWARAQFPPAARRVETIRSMLRRFGDAEDPVVLRAHEAIDAALVCFTSEHVGHQRPLELVRRALITAVAARTLRPSAVLDAVSLALSVLHGWLAAYHVSPLYAVARDLDCAQVPAELIPLAIELTALVWDAERFSLDFAEIDEASLQILPDDHARIPLLESLADRGWPCEAEIQRRYARTRDGAGLVHALARGAVRRLATNRPAEALEWAERGSLQLLRHPAAGDDDVGIVLEYIQRECIACCVLARAPRTQHADDSDHRLALAQESLNRVVPDLIERFDAEDPERFRAELERWCDETHGSLERGWRPGWEVIATLAWAHSTLAELAELDDEHTRWHVHKHRQLDIEDRFGIALTGCSVAVTAELGEHRCEEVLTATPSASERARQCLEEAERCRAQGDEHRAAFWLERARRYRPD